MEGSPFSCGGVVIDSCELLGILGNTRPNRQSLALQIYLNLVIGLPHYPLASLVTSNTTIYCVYQVKEVTLPIINFPHS